MEKLICPECGATMTMRTENRLYDADVRVTLADLRIKHSAARHHSCDRRTGQGACCRRIFDSFGTTSD